MKRIMALVVSVLLLVGLTACNQNVGRHADGIIKADKATIEIGSTHTAFDGMEIQIVNAVWNDEETKFDVNWINKTGHEVVYGDAAETVETQPSYIYLCVNFTFEQGFQLCRCHVLHGRNMYNGNSSQNQSGQGK